MACLGACSNCGERTIDRVKCHVCGDPKFVALQQQLEAKDEALREAKAAIVQLENDACVLRGQIEHGKE